MYPSEGTGEPIAKTAEISISIIQRYQTRIKRLEDELGAAKEVVDILQRNPEFEKLLAAMGKVRL